MKYQMIHQLIQQQTIWQKRAHAMIKVQKLTGKVASNMQSQNTALMTKLMLTGAECASECMLMILELGRVG